LTVRQGVAGASTALSGGKTVRRKTWLFARARREDKWRRVFVYPGSPEALARWSSAPIRPVGEKCSALPRAGPEKPPRLALNPFNSL